MRYVYRDVLDSVYEVPLVYFDLNDDYGLVYRRVQQELSSRGETSKNLQDWFISGRDIDPDAYDEIEYYTDSSVLAAVPLKLDLLSASGALFHKARNPRMILNTGDDAVVIGIDPAVQRMAGSEHSFDGIIASGAHVVEVGVAFSNNRLPDEDLGSVGMRDLIRVG